MFYVQKATMDAPYNKNPENPRFGYRILKNLEQFRDPTSPDLLSKSQIPYLGFRIYGRTQCILKQYVSILK